MGAVPERDPGLRKVIRNRHERGTDDAKVIPKRLDAAEGEMACAKEYTFQIINDDLEKAYHELKTVILSGIGLG